MEVEELRPTLAKFLSVCPIIPIRTSYKVQPYSRDTVSSALAQSRGPQFLAQYVD